MRNRIGTVCMILGTVLVMAALSLFCWNRFEDRQAKASAEQYLPQVMEYIEEKKETLPSGLSSSDSLPYDSMQTDYAADRPVIDTSMTEVEIDGYTYIGYVSIPGLELELPVMSWWDYPSLRTAPCRYSGSVKSDDMVIAAHNYEHHFGMLSKLASGDTVSFTDMDGILSVYEVEVVETLEPEAVEEMTSGEYDLTLFTCTYGGKSRVTVRCSRISEFPYR